MNDMNILVDTNILLDFLEDREPFNEAADRLFKQCEENRINGYIAVHSIPNIFYVLRKDYTVNERKDMLVGICEIRVNSRYWKPLATFRESLTTFRESLTTFRERLTTFWESLITFWERLTIFRESLITFCERLAIFRESLATFWEPLTTFPIMLFWGDEVPPNPPENISKVWSSMPFKEHI
jgi:predicted nucleic-acid-binding protein